MIRFYNNSSACLAISPLTTHCGHWTGLRKGAKTKTWFALPDEPLFAVAALWRDTEEWGLAYTMVMTEACIHVADVHDRMPVILRRDDWQDWLDGAPDDARILCRPYPDLMVVNRTADRWNSR